MEQVLLDSVTTPELVGNSTSVPRTKMMLESTEQSSEVATGTISLSRLIFTFKSITTNTLISEV